MGSVRRRPDGCGVPGRGLVSVKLWMESFLMVIAGLVMLGSSPLTITRVECEVDAMEVLCCSFGRVSEAS